MMTHSVLTQHRSGDTCNHMFGSCFQRNRGQIKTRSFRAGSVEGRGLINNRNLTVSIRQKPLHSLKRPEVSNANTYSVGFVSRRVYRKYFV